MRISRILFFGLILFGAFEAGAVEINWRGSGGWGAGLQYHRLYDTSTLQIVKGKIVRVAGFTPVQGMSDGVALWLQTRDESLLVHLGPSWFLERQNFSLQPRKRVEIKGSRISFEGEPILLASELREEDKVLLLRGEEGFPVWSAWRRR